jgi:ABC-type multidrug transport system permease subunit
MCDETGRRLNPGNYSHQKVLLSYIISKILSIVVFATLSAICLYMGVDFCLILGWKNFNCKCAEMKCLGK